MADEMTGQNENGPATRSELHSVKGILQGEIEAVKVSLQNDLRSVEKRLDGRMDRLETGQKKIMTTLSQVVGTLSEMKDKLATKAEVRELRSDMHTRMDGFAGSLNDFRRQWAYQSDALMGHEGRLNDHERRLQKLEPRPE